MSTVKERRSSLWLKAVSASDSTDADFYASRDTSLPAIHLAEAIQEEFDVAIGAIEMIERTLGGIVGLVETSLARE